jgi:hypothetical protein
VIWIDRLFPEFRATSIANSDAGNDCVKNRVDQRSAEQYENSPRKRLSSRRQDQECDGGEDHNRQAKLLWKIFSDE